MCLVGAEHENMGYGGKYDNIGHLGPIRVRNDPKHRKGPLRNRIESIKYLGKKSQKLELKTKDDIWK